ncbi:unnamed protein product, partial [Amoebophrya sp. A120]
QAESDADLLKKLHTQVGQRLDGKHSNFCGATAFYSAESTDNTYRELESLMDRDE